MARSPAADDVNSADMECTAYIDFGIKVAFFSPPSEKYRLQTKLPDIKRCKFNRNLIARFFTNVYEVRRSNKTWMDC